MKNIEEDDLILNADEWIINRGTPSLKSWSFRGERAEIKSISFEKSASIISVIFSTGWHFSHIHSQTINSNSFIDFLNDLEKFIRINQLNKNKRMILLLDNSTSHTAKVVIKAIKSLFRIAFFLPQYSPQYAPVENFFSSFKSKLVRNLQTKTNDLHTKFTQEEIEKALKKIGSKEIKRMWQHNYRTINEDNLKFFYKMKNSY